MTTIDRTGESDAAFLARVSAADPVEGALLRLAAVEEAHAAATGEWRCARCGGTAFEHRDSDCIWQPALVEESPVPWLLRLARERYALAAAILALADEMDRDAARSARVGCDDVAAERTAAAVRIRGTVTAALTGEEQGQ